MAECPSTSNLPKLVTTAVRYPPALTATATLKKKDFRVTITHNQINSEKPFTRNPLTEIAT